MESYASKTKAALLETVPKKNCCKRIMDDVLSLERERSGKARADKLASLSKFFKCNACKMKAVTALFIVFGSVTDPDKQYHLEFSFETEEERAAANELLILNNFIMKPTKRKNRYILYIKSSEQIEDLLAMIGANKAAFELINAKIIREVRGDANRQMNCDMANINKSIAAAEHIIDIIGEMHADGTILRLPAELRETAILRFENTQASMAELGALHNPSISKSGVKHRLDKIEREYHKFKEQK